MAWSAIEHAPPEAIAGTVPTIATFGPLACCINIGTTIGEAAVADSTSSIVAIRPINPVIVTASFTTAVGFVQEMMTALGS